MRKSFAYSRKKNQWIFGSQLTWKWKSGVTTSKPMYTCPWVSMVHKNFHLGLCHQFIRLLCLILCVYAFNFSESQVACSRWYSVLRNYQQQQIAPCCVKICQLGCSIFHYWNQPKRLQNLHSACWPQSAHSCFLSCWQRRLLELIVWTVSY